MPTIQPSAIAVVATSLAQTDRRTLSQAWYDALHLAHDVSGGNVATTGTASGERGPAVAARGLATNVAVTPERCSAHAPRPSGNDRLPRAFGPERRCNRGDLARRIERAIVRRPNAPVASLAVRLDAGRMQLLVRSDGPRVRIVALCLPHQRALVEVALASARFALAGRGITVDTVVRSAA